MLWHSSKLTDREVVALVRIPTRHVLPARPAGARRVYATRRGVRREAVPPRCGRASRRGRPASRTRSRATRWPRPPRMRRPSSSGGRPVVGRGRAGRHHLVRRVRREPRGGAQLAHAGDVAGEGRERQVAVLVGRDEAVPAGGPPKRGVGSRAESPDPDRDARLLDRPRQEGRLRRRGSARPSNENRSPLQSPSRIARLSSSIAALRRRSTSSPKVPNSASDGQPRPTPRTSRPPLSRSSDAVSRASFHGLRRGRAATIGPRRIRCVGLGDRRDRDPRVGDVERPGGVDQDVVPDEEAVPAGILGAHARARPGCADRRQTRSWGCRPRTAPPRDVLFGGDETR